MCPQKATTARWPLERDRKVCKILQRKLKCDPCQVTLHEPVFSHQHFRPCDTQKKKENANCGCELLLPPNFILLQLSKEQVFWDVSKTSVSEELFLETKYNSSANLADRCGYFSDKAPWDLIIPFSKRKKKINPLLSLYSSLQNILVCTLRKNGSFSITFINGY